jgi:hypothetical protein
MMKRGVRLAAPLHADGMSNESESLGRFFVALRKQSNLRDPRINSTASLETFLADFGRLKSSFPSESERRPKEVKVKGTAFSSFMLDFGSLADDLRKKGDFINVWQIAGLKQVELRNAAVLAWLFDANQTHGRGSAILLSFIRQIAIHHGQAFPLPKDLESYSVSTECYPLGNTENRVDIVIDGSNFIAFIEVKIRASEREQQIDRYLELAKAKAKTANKGEAYAVVFLTPERITTVLPPNVIAATWSDVAKAIEEVAQQSGDFGDRVLLQFAGHVAHF